MITGDFRAKPNRKEDDRRKEAALWVENVADLCGRLRLSGREQVFNRAAERNRGTLLCEPGVRDAPDPADLVSHAISKEVRQMEYEYDSQLFKELELPLGFDQTVVVKQVPYVMVEDLWEPPVYMLTFRSTQFSEKYPLNMRLILDQPMVRAMLLLMTVLMENTVDEEDLMVMFGHIQGFKLIKE